MSSKKVVVVSKNGHGHIPGKVEEGLLRWNQRKECQRNRIYIIVKSFSDLILNAPLFIFWLYIHIIPISYMSLCILFLFSSSCRVQCHPFSPLYQSESLFLFILPQRKMNWLTIQEQLISASSATDSLGPVNSLSRGAIVCIVGWFASSIPLVSTPQLPPAFPFPSHDSKISLYVAMCGWADWPSFFQEAASTVRWEVKLKDTVLAVGKRYCRTSLSSLEVP